MQSRLAASELELDDLRAVHGRLFGPERVQAVLRAMRGRPAPEVLTRLRDDATAFCGGRLADDLCLVALHAT